MKKPIVQITLLHSSNRRLGKPYRVVKFKNAVVVALEQPGCPRKEIRVGDCIDEEEAVSLAEGSEVIVHPVND